MSLILDNVSYVYEAGTPFEKKAVSTLCLEIKDGAFLGIAGTTGSGKSTLAKLLAKLIEPSEGKITCDRKTGIVFQYPEHQLFEETVLKDIMFGPLNQGIPEPLAKENAKKAMSLLGLDESFESRNPLNLSGGEKRRAAIAGILSMDPEVLILDEPAAGLDPLSHDRLFSFLKQLNTDGKTIIIVSHEMDDIATYCDTAMIMEDGKLLSYGKTSELLQCRSQKQMIRDDLKAKGLL